MVDSSEGDVKKGRVRSRWLWGLLAGVALVAIAAVFWIDQTSVLPPVSPRTLRQLGACALSPLHSPKRRVTRLRPHLRPRPRTRLRPHPLQTPTPVPHSDCAARSGSGAPMQDSKATSPPAPTAPSPEKPAAPPVLAQEPSPPPAPAPPAEAPPTPPPPAPGRESQEVAAHICAQDALRSWSGPGPIPRRRIASASSRGAAAAGPIASRRTSSAQAAIVESPKKILLPPPSAGSRAHP